MGDRIREYREIFLLILLFTIVSCDQEKKIPEGFEEIGGEGRAHFVYVWGKGVTDKLMQRVAGKVICERAGHEDYCDVYMWSERDKIPEKFPIMNKEVIVGLYTIRDGKTKLRALWQNKLDDREWYEKGIGER